LLFGGPADAPALPALLVVELAATVSTNTVIDSLATIDSTPVPLHPRKDRMEYDMAIAGTSPVPWYVVLPSTNLIESSLGPIHTVTAAIMLVEPTTLMSGTLVMGPLPPINEEAMFDIAPPMFGSGYFGGLLSSH
jgi:hypothetical protein